MPSLNELQADFNQAMIDLHRLQHYQLMYAQLSDLAQFYNVSEMGHRESQRDYAFRLKTAIERRLVELNAQIRACTTWQNNPLGAEA